MSSNDANVEAPAVDSATASGEAPAVDWIEMTAPEVDQLLQVIAYQVAMESNRRAVPRSLVDFLR